MKKVRLLLFCYLILALSCASNRGKTITNAKNAREKMARLADILGTKDLPYQRWWVPDFGKFLQPDGTLKKNIADWILDNLENLKKRAALYSTLPDTRGLPELLERSMVGAVTGGQYGRIQATFPFKGKPTANEAGIKQALKILYFGADQRKVVTGSNEAAAIYVSQVDVLLIPCLEFKNQTVRDAMIMHELKHAQQQRQAIMFGINPELKIGGHISDAMADNEMAAHKLSGEILNVGSGGQFMDQVNKVTAKSAATSPESFFIQLRPEDITGIDELFGKTGSFESAIRHSFIYFVLVANWIEKHMPPDSQARAKREFYLKTGGEHQ